MLWLQNTTAWAVLSDGMRRLFFFAIVFSTWAWECNPHRVHCVLCCNCGHHRDFLPDKLNVRSRGNVTLVTWYRLKCLSRCSFSWHHPSLCVFFFLATSTLWDWWNFIFYFFSWYLLPCLSLNVPLSICCAFLRFLISPLSSPSASPKFSRNTLPRKQDR